MVKKYENMTNNELREKLASKGLPTSGNKSELIFRLHGNGGGKKSSKSNVPENVIDKDLYRRVRNKVKRRISVWPSAYASGQVVSEYKKAGGRYKGSKKSSAPLDRWYKEEWVNVCKPKSGSGGSGYAKCGRSKSSVTKYPYCRPSKRISKATPMTVGELKKKYGKKKLDELCKKKRSKALPKKGKAQRIQPKETRRNSK